MILIMKILLHNEYKIINLWYPTYVYQFFYFPYNYKNRLLACFQTRPTKLFILFFTYNTDTNKVLYIMYIVSPRATELFRDQMSYMGCNRLPNTCTALVSFRGQAKP